MNSVHTIKHGDNRPWCKVVLVADDHEVLRHGLGELMKRELGVSEVLEAEHFEKALELAGTFDPNLAIVDLDMPGMPGPEALTSLRRLSPDTKVVVLSGSERRKDIVASLAAGVHGYILKAASADDLINYLKRILLGEIYVPPVVAKLNEKQAGSNDADTPRDELLSRLTPRQVEVLNCIELGMSNKEIAKKLQLSSRTVKMHVSAVIHILGVRNRIQAARLVQRSGQDTTSYHDV